jgi:hypothetical protein
MMLPPSASPSPYFIPAPEAEARSVATGVRDARELSPALIKNMLRLENEMRLGDVAMAEYDKARANGEDPFQIPEQIQIAVAVHFGLEPSVAMDAMRCAETLPQMTAADVEEVVQISHYRRYNRCMDGTLQVGDHSPDVSLFRLPNCSAATTAGATPLVPCALSAVAPPSSPLLLVAASYS